MLAAQYGATPEQAFQMLLRQSQRQNHKLALIAAEVVAATEPLGRGIDPLSLLAGKRMVDAVSERPLHLLRTAAERLRQHHPAPWRGFLRSGHRPADLHVDSAAQAPTAQALGACSAPIPQLWFGRPLRRQPRSRSDRSIGVQPPPPHDDADGDRPRDCPTKEAGDGRLGGGIHSRTPGDGVTRVTRRVCLTRRASSTGQECRADPLIAQCGSLP
jgi:hypothetical protein